MRVSYIKVFYYKYFLIFKKEEIMETLIKIIINVSLLLGSGYPRQRTFIQYRENGH